MVMEDWSTTGDASKKYYLLCLTLDGIPLFTRIEGQLPNLPFSIVGSLNGIHMFVKNQLVDMGVTSADNAKIIWKDFANIRLIYISFDTSTSSYHLNSTIQNIYNCIVMTIGENELTKITNVEKLKKKIRLCIPLLTNLLSGSLSLLGSITQVSDIIHISEPTLLQNCLNAFTTDCQSEFGCLTAHGKILAATEKFWQLQSIETLLLLYLLNSVPTTASCDIPMYLPNGSPTVPHRLLIVCLVEHIHVMIICGPEPSLQDVLNKQIKKYWLPVVPLLKSCLRSHPRGFAPELKVDPNVLSFMLINRTDGKCLSSFHPHGHMTGGDQIHLIDLGDRKDALCRFYKSIVEDLFTSKTDNDNSPLDSEVTETYQCYNQYKCYGMKTTSHEIFILFSVDIPTYAMGNITRQTLKQLLKDRLL